MQLAVVIGALVLAACASKDAPSESAHTPSLAPPMAPPSAPPAAIDAAPAPALPPPPPAPTGHDFTPVAQQLVAIASCGGGEIPEGFPTERIERHCAAVTATREEYAKRWVALARPFFAELVPVDAPKKVVYPFAGGDLSTALTVFPDADEITTMSLEPAGDPRTLEVLRKKPGALKQNTTKFEVSPTGKPWTTDEADVPIAKAPTTTKGKAGLDRALATIQYELNFLYKVNFSNTMNMIDAMRGGQLPTQLVFGLSALHVHGFEVVSLRYFKLADDGSILYLDDADLAKAPDPVKGAADVRNRIFANAELRFRKPGGRVQVYRHLQVNLDNAHLKKDPRVLRHLEAKGPVSGMTKAASYLLAWDEFSTIRDYLIDHVAWMVSDATGVPPKFGRPAGFAYTTYGAFHSAHIAGGNQIAKDWRDEYAKQEKRPLKFRFGYYDGSDAHSNHLIVMQRAP